MNKELTLQDFYINFRPFADAKNAYQFAKWLLAVYANDDKNLWWVENGRVIFDHYASTGSMDFDHNGVHDSGLRTPELGRIDRDHEYFIRWCWYPE